MSEIVYVNTCVFASEKMHLVPDYIERYKGKIGFEILSMFDLSDFEDELKKVIPDLQKCPISFHGPVFCAEHSAANGTPEYEETMWHIRKTLEYARILHSTHMTMHLNNCVVTAETKERMLKNALENYKELEELFGEFGCKIFVENTGTRLKNDILLDQDEFTELCIKKGFDVLIDVGHAFANSWDIPKLIKDLKGQIRAYHLHNNDGSHDSHLRIHEGAMDIDEIFKNIKQLTPDAELIIEYIRREQEGDGLKADIEEVLDL